MTETTARELLDARRRGLEQTRAAAEREIKVWETSPSEELSSQDQHPADLATDLVERERAFSVLEMTEAALHEVEDAYRSLEAGRYGRCEVCGHPIPAARLRVRPEARSCVEHAPSPAA
jgi:RNA polymerase-binding transcription factor DksA